MRPDLGRGWRGAVITLTVVFAVGCGGDEARTSSSTEAATEAATDGMSHPVGVGDVCDDVDSLRSSIDELTSVDISAEGLAAIPDRLERVKADVRALKESARAALEPQLDDIEQAVSSLSDSSSAAAQTQSAATLRDVAMAIRSLVRSLNALRQAIADAC